MTDSRHIELGWQSTVVPCGGGLLLNIDALTQGTTYPGSARVLQNFESSLDGGYRKMNGYTTFDTNTVPGTGPILGVKYALGGAFAVRLNTTDNQIFFSSGSGWGSKLNSASRTGSVTKARAIQYSISGPSIIFVDGVNFAWKYSGGSDTLINGTGAPQGAQFVSFFNNSIALAGYGTGNKVSISAPDTDTDFNGANGAVEINFGDTIVGLKTFRNNLVVFGSRTVRVITVNPAGTTPIYSISEVAKGVGCAGQDTIQEVAGDLIYLSLDSFRSYAATNKIDDVVLDSVSQSIQPIVISNILSQGFTANQYSSVVIRNKGQYRLYINDPNNTTINTFGVAARVQDTPVIPHGQYEWSTMLGTKPYCADSDVFNNLEIAILGDPSNGLVYQLESGNTFNGTPIQAVYKSPDLTFADATLRKVYQRITLNTEVEGNFSTTLNLILDKGNAQAIQPPAMPLSQSGVLCLYGSTTSLYGNAGTMYSEFIIPTFRQTLVGSGFTGAFQFFSQDTNSPYRIDSYQIEFTMKSRR